MPCTTLHMWTNLIVFPLWAPTLLFAALPLCVFVGGAIRRCRARDGERCMSCDYNLTGNVSGICPECGTAVRGAIKRAS